MKIVQLLVLCTVGCAFLSSAVQANGALTFLEKDNEAPRLSRKVRADQERPHSGGMVSMEPISDGGDWAQFFERAIPLPASTKSVDLSQRLVQK